MEPPNLRQAKACFGCEHSNWRVDKPAIAYVFCSKHQVKVAQIFVCDDWEED